MSAVQLTLDELLAGAPAAGDMHRPARELARNTDPSTSRDAARLDHGTNRWKILTVFARAFGRAQHLTYIQAAQLAGIEPHEAARRIADLTRLGYLQVVVDRDGKERTARLPSGRSGRLHMITPEGSIALTSTIQDTTT